MIQLRTLNGEDIELKSNEITLELNNSLFNDGSQLKGSFSYPISLAMSPNNIRLFGFANQLEVYPNTTNYHVYVRIGSKAFRRAVLNVSMNENAFEGTLKIGIGSISERGKTVKLTEIPFPKYSLGNTQMGIQNNMMLAARNTNWQIIPYTFLPTRNADFCGLLKKDAPPGTLIPPTLVNEMTFTGGQGTFNVSIAPNTNQGQIVPYFYLVYVLKQVAEFFDFTLTGDFITHPDIQRVLIYNVNGTLLFHSPHAKIEFSAQNHLPSIAITEFFKAVCGFFCCKIKVDEKRQVLDFSWKKTAFEKRSYNDWSEKLVSVINQRFVDPSGYTISAQLNNTEKRDEVFVGGRGERVETKAGTLQFIKETLPNSSNVWRIPKNDLAGNVTDELFTGFQNYREAGSKFNEFPLRFLYTNGVVTENSISYPQGTSEGNKFNLQISGQKGLFNYAHKSWLERTYASKTIKARLLLSENDLNQLDDEDIIQIRSQNGATVECLIKKLTFSNTNQRDFFIAEAEMVALGAFDMTVVGATENVVVGAIEIFTRLSIINRTSAIPEVDKTDFYGDIRIQLFEDAKCTIPHVGNFVKVRIAITRTHLSRFIPRRGPSRDTNSTDTTVFRDIEFKGESEHIDEHVLIGNTSIYGRDFNAPRTEEYWNDAYQIEKSPGYTVVN